MDDRVRGVQYRGLLFYMKDLNLTKIRAHIKYVYVRPQILSLEKREDDRTIRVEWRHVGLTTLRMGLRYNSSVRRVPGYLKPLFAQVHSG